MRTGGLNFKVSSKMRTGTWSDLIHFLDEKLLRMKAITTFLAAWWFNKRHVRLYRKASAANIRFQCSRLRRYGEDINGSRGGRMCARVA